MCIVSKAILEACNIPDHMNYELLGNSNPHLHWHIVPPHKTDPCWGRPIGESWPRNQFNTNHHILTEAENTQLVNDIRAAL